MLTLSGAKAWASRHRLIVMFAGATALAFTFVEFAPAFQECVRANHPHNGNQTPYEKLSGFFWLQYWCAGTFLHETGDIITAIATVVMAAFTGTLWWSTATSAELTRQTVDLAEKQFLMEGKQADLAERQHGLARLQHIAANKPRLGVRSIVIIRPRPDGAMIQNGHPIKGSLVVRNSGATEAEILESGYRFLWSNAGLPMAPPLNGPETKPLFNAGDKLEAFGSCEMPIESHGLAGTWANTVGVRTALEFKVYVMGFIKYRDINEAERLMGFCRVYEPPSQPFQTSIEPEGHFVTVDNGDYEYED